MANVEFGTAKTVVVLSVVAACFAVLWPKILYPLFMGKTTKNFHSDNLDGCCDVMFETDINAIKIMNDLCGSILSRQPGFDPKLSQTYHQGRLSEEVVNTCRTEVSNMCGIDIAEFLNKKEQINHSYKQMLDEIRSFNISICLRHHFGVNPGLLGTPRRMRIWSPSTPRYLRQERPLHFRPEIIHPALREKGRAIPQSHVVPKVSGAKEYSRQIPVPGKRPTLGGPGHVIPPPKVGGTLSVIMPIYTVGIVLFFTYTVMKIFSRKTQVDNEYNNYNSDPEFRRVVFSEDYSNGCAARIKEDKIRMKGRPETFGKWKSPTDDSTRLGDIEIDQLRKRLEETEKAMERIVAQMETVPTELLTETQLILRIMSAITGLLAEVDQQLVREGDAQNQYNTELKSKKTLEEYCSEEVPATKKMPDLLTQVDMKEKEVKNGHAGAHQDLQDEREDDAKPKVKVVGLELMAECEGGQKWSRPATPSLGVGGSSRSATPVIPFCDIQPHNIFLEGALPQQSQLLVSDSKTQTFTAPDGDEHELPVILSSKMTLSLISLDAALPDENIRHDYSPSQSQIDLKSENNDNLGNADSTLLGDDSEFIDEPRQNENGILDKKNKEAMAGAVNEEGNEAIEGKLLREEAAATDEGLLTRSDFLPEDTAADVSSLDGWDLKENQENLHTDKLHLCNGSSQETDKPNESESPESRNSQHENATTPVIN